MLSSFGAVLQAATETSNAIITAILGNIDRSPDAIIGQPIHAGRVNIDPGVAAARLCAPPASCRVRGSSIVREQS